MQRLTHISRWAERTLSLFLLAGALAMPLMIPQARSVATHMSLGSFVLHSPCPGAPVGG
jgi:hypothetical protein